MQHPGEGLGRILSLHLALPRLEEQVPAEGQEIHERVHIALLRSTGNTWSHLTGGEAQPRLGPRNNNLAVHQSVKVSPQVSCTDLTA